MNHKRHYDLLIAKAKVRNKPEGYTERHHIIPRCMGGSDEKDNLVVLTGREHFIAHLLLAHVYGGYMWSTVARMAKGLAQHNSCGYEIARKKHSENVSKSNKGNEYAKNCKNALGSKHTEEHKRKMSEFMRGNKYSLGHKHTEETKKKLSAIICSEETRLKMSVARKGKKIPPKSKEHGCKRKSFLAYLEAIRLKRNFYDINKGEWR